MEMIGRNPVYGDLEEMRREVAALEGRKLKGADGVSILLRFCR